MNKEEGASSQPISDEQHNYRNCGDGKSPKTNRRRSEASAKAADVFNTRSYRWQEINDRRVDDITLEFFYKPHTLTLLVVVLCVLVVIAFASDDTVTENNIWAGVKTLCFLFLIVSLLTFPNGPYTRPHPALWRVVFGVSVLYFFLLVFALFQKFSDIKRLLRWLDPENLQRDAYEEKEYAVNCSDITWERLYGHLDVYAFGHFFGWAMKALLLRHTVILWYLSVTWELTELMFMHILPNFEECWWDSWILDVLICNGLGIWWGISTSRWLEMQSFHWESVKHIRTTRGKIKRIVLQFTPQSWTHMRWLDPQSSYMRLQAVTVLVICWQVTELNTFFLKHIFAIDTGHWLSVGRILLIGAISSPTIRQYYAFVTDPGCDRLGTQCWVYMGVLVSETLICIKFGLPLFKTAQIVNMAAWFAMMVKKTKHTQENIFGSILCLYLSVNFAKLTNLTREVNVNGEIEHRYVESSVENLVNMNDETELRHRRLGGSESDG